MEPLSERLNRPLRIGNMSIPRRLTLSPMTYLGHIALRQVIDSYGGCGLLFTEMCDAGKVPNENRYRSPFFKWRDDERRRLVCQIFGDDPEKMATAARRIQHEGFFGVDINFGCAAGAICRRNSGAALLKMPGLAVEIVTRIRKAISIPILIKFRTGWQDNPEDAIHLARRFEEAGADALTYHPRVAPDRRTRPPKWEYIGWVKQAVSIPVFGNGNVFSAGDCLRMMQQTACDGVALGRLAVAKPWIFAEWTDQFQSGTGIYLDTVKQLAGLLATYYEPLVALQRFKRFSLYFAANFKYGHSYYRRISKALTLADARKQAIEFLSLQPEMTSTPNLNFFV